MNTVVDSGTTLESDGVIDPGTLLEDDGVATIPPLLVDDGVATTPPLLLVSVTGQMVVYDEIVSVVTDPIFPGQSVIVAAHEVIVYTEVT